MKKEGAVIEMNKTESIVSRMSVNDLIDKLTSIDPNKIEANFEIVDEETKLKIEEYGKEIDEYLDAHKEFESYTEEQKNEYFEGVTGIHSKLKESIKYGICNFQLTGSTINFLRDKLKTIELNAETVFYGLHLHKHWLDTLPRVKNVDTLYDLTITFSHAVVLHHLLSELTVKGINNKAAYYADILYNMSEISKCYQYYDRMSNIKHKNIMEWNMELTGAKDHIENIRKTVEAKITEEE